VIGLSLTIPSLVLLGFGHTYLGLIGAAVLFGVGYGMFDTNNMPILCQIIPQRYRATSYGIMNMMGVFAGYVSTRMLGSSTDAGNLGADFSKLSIVVLARRATDAALREAEARANLPGKGDSHGRKLNNKLTPAFVPV